MHSTTVIAFPFARARLGLRGLLARARAEIQTSAQHGAWKEDGSGVTPDFLLAQLPGDEELRSMSDADVAQIAIRTSLLALHALHHEIWDAHTLLGFLHDLQAAGCRVEEKTSPRSAAAT